MTAQSIQYSLSPYFMLVLVLAIRPVAGHTSDFDFYLPPYHSEVDEYSPVPESEIDEYSPSLESKPAQNINTIQQEEIQQEEPFFCKDYQTNYDAYNGQFWLSLTKLGLFATVSILLTRSIVGGVNPNNYWHKPIFFLNLVTLVSWSIPQASYTNKYTSPVVKYRKVVKPSGHTATVGSNSTQFYKEEPAAGYVITGLTFAGLNLLADFYNANNPSPGPGVNLLENFAIGAKSIGFTSNVASAFRTHFKNDYLSKGYTNYEATAAASRDVVVIYIVGLAGAMNTNLLDFAALEGINTNDIERSSWAMVHYVGRKYVHVSLPAGLMISAAYETIGSLENYCMASFDQTPPYSHYEESARLVFCKGLSSASMAGMGALALLKYSSGLALIYLENAAEAAGLQGTETAIDMGRNLFDHPVAKDTVGFIMGGLLTASSLYLNLYHFPGPFMTNFFHGAALIIIFEGGSMVVSHSYPTLGKILALGHTVTGTYDSRCQSRNHQE